MFLLIIVQLHRLHRIQKWSSAFFLSHLFIILNLKNIAKYSCKSHCNDTVVELIYFGYQSVILQWESLCAAIVSAIEIEYQRIVNTQREELTTVSEPISIDSYIVS